MIKKTLQQRLQKVIALRSNYSRRTAEQLILNNQVKVNGEIINILGIKVNVDSDIIIANKEVLPLQAKKIYLMLNKPKNCITSTFDPQKRTTIFYYLKDIATKIYPIGRLDYDTTGLLLLTNDGDFANFIAHPKYKINKIYMVKVAGKINSSLVNQLLRGVIIDEDFLAKAINIKILEKKVSNYTLEITIQDGRNQQIKKMISAIKGRVISLKRVAIGSLKLDNLKIGTYRYLTNEELKSLLSLK